MAPRQVGSRSVPRDELLCGNASVLSDAALLSVVVGECASESVAALLADGSIAEGIWRVSAEELVDCAGVGPAGAARILACLEVSRRASAVTPELPPIVSTPEDVVGICGPQLRGLDREHFWALGLNTRNRLLRLVEVSVGSLNASIVHPRELFKEAVRLSAASVVVVHNHPSGDPTPSSADIRLTRRLVRAGDVMGIEVLDHVVIGDGGDFVSLKESGLM
jgi:DNA repair protein RadC